MRFEWTVALRFLRDGRFAFFALYLVASAASGSMRSADFDFLVALASLASAACAGHAGSTVGRNAAAADLGSQQTVGLDSVVMLDAADRLAGTTAACQAPPPNSASAAPRSTASSNSTA